MKSVAWFGDSSCALYIGVRSLLIKAVRATTSKVSLSPIRVDRSRHERDRLIPFCLFTGADAPFG